MAEPIEDESSSDRQSDAAAQLMRRELSQTISRRVEVSKSATPRIGGKAEVCDVVYEKALQDEEGDALDSTADLQRQARTSQEKRKLVIILVGLPGRGKTYLCNKLLCYLNWCAAAARPCLAEGFSETLSSPSAVLRAEHVRSCLQQPRTDSAHQVLCYQPLLKVLRGLHSTCGGQGSACLQTHRQHPCRLGHISKHFNVGKYRRELKGDTGDEQDAHFFDHSNEVRQLVLQPQLLRMMCVNPTLVHPCAP